MSCPVCNCTYSGRGYDEVRDGDRWLGWEPKDAIGYYPVTDPVYDQAYFDKYVGYAQTELGRKLNHFRFSLVSEYTSQGLCDVGVGSGSFVEYRRSWNLATYGYDINPVAKRWLEGRNLWFDPYREPIHAVSLWDTLEHMPYPCELWPQVRRFVFVSLPLFTGPEHALASRHYRPDEHYWYFTEQSLLAMMGAHGFVRCERRNDETKLGREDIATFVFRRTG